MKIKIAHIRNNAMGWNINVNVEAGDQQQISQVTVKVNGVPVVEEGPGEDLDSWEKQLLQQGVYPGDNKVEVLVTDQRGKESRAKQEWS
jgi:hypothetical protein